MNWFQQLTGFEEQSPEQVRQNLRVEGDRLTSLINGQTWRCGQLEIPSLGELRQRLQSKTSAPGSITVKQVVGDVKQLHADPANIDALFQVASQFNLLEMVAPTVTPEEGITRYEFDRTQGPTCAIACGAGTIYRNYFVPVRGQIGQSQDYQIDCLENLGQALGNHDHHYWRMSNGYALAELEGLTALDQKLQSLSPQQWDELRQLVRIGIQWHTDVTIVPPPHHPVTQIYCSGLPIAYCARTTPLPPWQNFAQLILESTYEATIITGILNYLATGNNQVFLTLVGGGVFGNREEWIMDAIARALKLYAHYDLDVAIVSYGRSKPFVQKFIEAIGPEL